MPDVEKKSAGRPTKFTEALAADLVLRVRSGGTAERIANALGIGTRTYYRWMELGREGREPYATFRQDVLRARDTAVINAEAKVRDNNPLAFLRYSPAARSTRDVPGWTALDKYEGDDAPPEPDDESIDGGGSYDYLMSRLDDIAERMNGDITGNRT